MLPGWRKQAEKFMLMTVLGRAVSGAGWVKCWEPKKHPCAAGMMGIQHPIPPLVPRAKENME